MSLRPRNAGAVRRDRRRKVSASGEASRWLKRAAGRGSLESL